MPNDTHDLRTDSATFFQGLGLHAADGSEGFLAEAGLWLSGGVALLLWTGIALLLTSA
jgi:hypothetical protein